MVGLNQMWLTSQDWAEPFSGLCQQEGRGKWQLVRQPPVSDTLAFKIFSTVTTVGLQDYCRWYMGKVVCGFSFSIY